MSPRTDPHQESNAPRGAMQAWLLSTTLREEIARAASEAQQRQIVRTAFGSYVDSRVVDRVLAGDIKVKPERRVITVMFVDIRGFTRMAESQDPTLVFRRLDEILEAFAIEVQRQGGIVNKFLGDGLMAIFGAPEEQLDHPQRAVVAALRILEAARQQRDDGRFPGLAVGVGIHTGEAVVGDIGGARREYPRATPPWCCRGCWGTRRRASRSSCRRRRSRAWRTRPSPGPRASPRSARPEP